MLTRFEVTNFKSFKDKFVFDFTNTSDYQFNPECVKNGIVNKGIIYGVNGSGKSNLGLAIFDIVSHLTDKKFQKSFYKNYLNANSINEIAEFKYIFQFDKNNVEYLYGKTDVNTLVYEKLIINNKKVIEFNRKKSNKAIIEIAGAENLNTEIGDSKISVINYVKNSTVRIDSLENSLFDKFIEFINKMLFFKNLMGEIFYLGLEESVNDILSDIVKRDNIENFQDFLNRAGVQCQLKKIERDGESSMAFSFSQKDIFFADVSSTGTDSLTILYFWLQRLKENNKVSFVFIDEFDAFYHQKLSKLVVKELKQIDAQVILTTHNTGIMNNELMRPDCYFIMDYEKIAPLSKRTDGELRSAHNLEKMYKAGAFNE